VTWSKTGRKLPGNWKTIRLKVFKRDNYTCQLDCGRSLADYPDLKLECHHVGDKDNHDLDNLSTACHECHSRETAKQSYAAGNGYAEYRRKIAESKKKFRTQERHPGYLV